MQEANKQQNVIKEQMIISWARCNVKMFWVINFILPQKSPEFDLHAVYFFGDGGVRRGWCGFWRCHRTISIQIICIMTCAQTSFSPFEMDECRNEARLKFSRHSTTFAAFCVVQIVNVVSWVAVTTMVLVELTASKGTTASKMATMQM